jgi:hypothetical protein
LHKGALLDNFSFAKNSAHVAVLLSRPQPGRSFSILFSVLCLIFEQTTLQLSMSSNRRSRMTTITQPRTTTQFPAAEVETMLRESLDAVASDTEFARPDRQEWEPLLDSLCVVGVVVRLAILLEIKIPPDRVVQKGGYKSVDEAIRGITSKTRDLWMNRNATRI